LQLTELEERLLRMIKEKAPNMASRISLATIWDVFGTQEFQGVDTITAADQLRDLLVSLEEKRCIYSQPDLSPMGRSYRYWFRAFPR
jgi:hypothetical protein